MSNPTTPTPAPAVWLGWDWADLKHDLHLLTDSQPRGTHAVLANQPALLHAYLQQLHARFPDQAVGLAFEANRSALLPIFSAYTPWLRIYPINPKSLARYREALHPSGTKDDCLDCRLLAELARTHQAQLRPWTPPDPLTQELALLVEHRRGMVEQRTALANQLKALLKNYFPLSLDWLHNDTAAPFAALWVRQWPTLAALQSATPGAIRRFYRRHDHRVTRRLEALLATRAQAVAVSTATAWVSPHALHAQDLACQLHTLAQRLAQTEALIAPMYEQHPAYRLVHSLPGAGPALGPRLAALLSDDPTRFADAQALATATGIAPGRWQSGQTTLVRRRRACSHFLHQTLLEFAQQSVRYCAWAARFHAAKQAAGWGSYRIFRALAFKWCRILYALHRSGQTYDEARYQATLHQHASPYATVEPARP